MAAALEARHRFGISCWDAAFIEASRATCFAAVLSEDLDDRTDYAGSRVQDPFEATWSL
ncbi:MAG: hypothetical protein IT302_05000 [Dehalococcoidia bacterium]|nr:hypothetical protein [Dehalococcoidia bacterium]